MKIATKDIVVYVPALKASKNKYALQDKAKLIDLVQLDMTYDITEHSSGFNSYADIPQVLSNMLKSNLTWEPVILKAIIPEGSKYDILLDGLYWSDRIIFTLELGDPRNERLRNTSKIFYRVGTNYWEKDNNKRRNLF